MSGSMAVCSGCGRTPPAGEPTAADGTPWTWSVGRDLDRVADSDRTSVLCTGCAREHARSIEAKLDAEWW